MKHMHGKINADLHKKCYIEKLGSRVHERKKKEKMCVQKLGFFVILSLSSNECEGIRRDHRRLNETYELSKHSFNGQGSIEKLCHF